MSGKLQAQLGRVNLPTDEKTYLAHISEAIERGRRDGKMTSEAELIPLLERAFEHLDSFKGSYRIGGDGKFHKEWRYNDEESFKLWIAIGKRLGRDTRDLPA